MADTPIPERVTNKHLYQVILDGMKERTKMKEEIVKKIDTMETHMEHRLTRLETCVDGQKKDIDILKRRDILNGGLSAVFAAIAGYLGVSK